MHASGSAVLQALIAGYEVMTRLACAAPHRLTRVGFHASSVYGVPAAATSAALLRCAESQHVMAAMGIATSQASGIIQTVSEGGDLKAFHLGWAAHGAIYSAELAHWGVEGPMRAIEGQHGLLASFLHSGDYDLGRITRGLGSEWETMRIVEKPYPCCHFTHAIIDAALGYRAEFKDGTDAIGRVTCQVPLEAVHVVCEPWAERLAPRGPYSAKFSLPYCIAVALRDGAVRTNHFTSDALRRQDLRSLMYRVTYETDPDPNLARTYGAELVIQRLDGQTWRKRILHPTGSVDKPSSPEEIVRKFQDCVTSVIGRERAINIQNLLLHLEDVEDVSDGVSSLGVIPREVGDTITPRP